MIPGRECKISAKLARFERFDIVYSNDWRNVCHFDVAYTGPGPLSCKTATQISNPRFDCHSSRNGDGDCGLAGREIESSRIDVSSRTPPMQMHRSSLFFLFSSSPFFILHAFSLALYLFLCRSFGFFFSNYLLCRWILSVSVYPYAT